MFLPGEFLEQVDLKDAPQIEEEKT